MHFVDVLFNSADRGGGIFNRGTGLVTLADQTGIRNNTALGAVVSDTDPDGGGGIYNQDDGQVLIADSWISYNSATSGGGILNRDRGTVAINDTYIDDNVAEFGGGGVSNYHYGAVAIVTSSINSNEVLFDGVPTGQGGGVYIYQGDVSIARSEVIWNTSKDGGGVFNRNGDLEITNSTISENAAESASGGAGGGIFAQHDLVLGGATVIRSSTIAENEAMVGGGVYWTGTPGVDPPVDVANSIIANNLLGRAGSAGSGRQRLLQFAGLQLDRRRRRRGRLWRVGDLVGDVNDPVDPMLGSLGFNGGPNDLYTHALLPGSPAIDAGSTPLGTDQRGGARPQDGDGDSIAAADIGAYEVALDYGDADILYPTLAVQDGAVHNAVGPTLGPNRDAEFDGAPSPHADGDDTLGVDDEDGVTFTSSVLVASSVAAVTVSVQVDLQNADPSANYLNAWIDFNRDGDWGDPGEQIFDTYFLGVTNGVQTLNFSLPVISGGNVVGGDTYARFRLSSDGYLAPTGAAADGEVEDYLVTLAANLVVTTTVDEDDGVTDPVLGFGTSLREAINFANANPGLDYIAFNIPLSDPGHVYYQNDGVPGSLSTVATTTLPDGSITDFDLDYPLAPHSWFRIQPTTALPTITEAVFLDGFTQPGASPNTNPAGSGLNSVLMIELDGSLAGSVSGLVISGADSTVRGLAVNRFDTALTISGLAASGNTVAGNFLGVDITGAYPAGNSFNGLRISGGAHANWVGTNGDAVADETEGNVISSNLASGIFLSDTGTDDNVIAGNFIGTDYSGTLALPNLLMACAWAGAACSRTAPLAQTGTESPTWRNATSSRKRPCRRLHQGLDTSNNWVAGNYIGADVNGAASGKSSRPACGSGLRRPRTWWAPTPTESLTRRRPI